MKKSFRIQAIVSLLLLTLLHAQAQNLSDYTLKSSSINNGITEKVYVLENEFGDIIKSIEINERENGDYYKNYKDGGKTFKEYRVTDSNLGVVLTFKDGKYVLTYPNGNRIESLVEVVEKDFAYGKFFNLRGYEDKSIVFSERDSYALANAGKTKFFRVGDTEGMPYLRDQSCIIYGVSGESSNSGFKMGDRLVRVTKTGEVEPYMQKLPNFKGEERSGWMYAIATDTIIGFQETSGKTPYGEKVDTLIIRYANKDFVRSIRKGSDLPVFSIKLHRNGGIYNNNMIKFPDGSSFQFGQYQYKDGSLGYFSITMLGYPELPLYHGRLTKADGTVAVYQYGKNKAEEEAKLAAEKAKKEEEKKAAEKAKYNELCRKYGKANVDKFNSIKDVWVGMPEGLMKEVCSNSLEFQSATRKQYYLYNILNKPFKSVWVSNGKITSISKF